MLRVVIGKDEDKSNDNSDVYYRNLVGKDDKSYCRDAENINIYYLFCHTQ